MIRTLNLKGRTSSMTAAITVENICDVCEVGGGCSEPCEKWYKCLAGAARSRANFGTRACKN